MIRGFGVGTTDGDKLFARPRLRTVNVGNEHIWRPNGTLRLDSAIEGAEEAARCAESRKTYQVQKPFSLSSPIPHSVRSTTSSPCHPANRSAWSRIEREKQRYIPVLEVFVEIFPLHASLDDRIAVCLGHLEDFVHEREI